MNQEGRALGHDASEQRLTWSVIIPKTALGVGVIPYMTLNAAGERPIDEPVINPILGPVIVTTGGGGVLTGGMCRGF